MEEIKIKELILDYLSKKYGEENINSKKININNIIEIKDNKPFHLELILKEEILTLISRNSELIEYLKEKFNYYDSEEYAIWVDINDII